VEVSPVWTEKLFNAKEAEMKRLFLYVVVGLMLASLVLTACNAKATPTPTSAPKPTDTPVPTAVPMIKAVVAMDATWPPFEFVDEATKEIVGFDVDLMKAIAEKGGFEVEFVNVSWDPLLAGMAQCQYDASISAMTITEDRKKSFMFSDPYFAAGQIVTVAVDNTEIKSKDDLVGKTVGAQLGTTGAIEAEKMSGVNLKTYDDIGLAFQDLINNQIDAVVADNPLALGYVGENPDKLKAVGEVFTDEYYGIAVCKDNTDLLAKINAGLAAVKAEGVIDQLVAKWITSGGK
jgi:polar amino acid transport system substrate-binding protein